MLAVMAVCVNFSSLCGGLIKAHKRGVLERGLCVCSLVIETYLGKISQPAPISDPMASQ